MKKLPSKTLRVVLAVVFFLLADLLFGQTRFSLQNSEEGSFFEFWVIKTDRALSAKELLQELPKALVSRQVLGPTEKIPVVLNPGEIVAGVFVSWNEPLQFRSLLDGGYLFPQEASAGRTVLLTKANFLAFNQKRRFQATLQDLGIPVPQFEPGNFSDWTKVLPLSEFGASFAPRVFEAKAGSVKVSSLPSGPSLPKIVLIQGALFDQALWFHLKADRPLLASQPLWSVNLRWKDSILEIPVQKASRAVWYWRSPTASPQAIGLATIRDSDLEIWFPLSRFSQEETTSFLGATVDFSQVFDFNGSTWDLLYTSFQLQELP